MSQERPEGRLEIQVVAGRNIPRRSRIGRGDSLVSMTLGTSTKQTRVDKRGGSSPQWNDRITFLISGLGKNQLHVTAYEIEATLNQRKIGSCVVDLAKIFVEEEVDGWFTLTNGEKSMGDVYIEFTYTPKGGRKRPSKAHVEEEEEDIAFLVEPKTSKSSNGTVASAPAMIEQDRPSTSSLGGKTPVPSSLSANMQLRPSMSDLRPYSSASMHSSELANKYAQKHGTKPLPAAPNMSAPISGYDTGYPGGFQPQASGVYDDTLMPGQIPFAQVQQRPMSYGGESLPMQYQGTMSSMAPAQPQQQQLMTLFAPPGAPEQPHKALPEPPSNPAYNPAYNPDYNPAYNPAFVADMDAQQQPVGHSSLPVPANARPVSAMSAAPQQPMFNPQLSDASMCPPQQPMQYASYPNPTNQQAMGSMGYSYSSMHAPMTVASPEQYQPSAYDPYMPPQSYAPDMAMSQPQYPQQPMNPAYLQQPQPMDPHQQQFVQQPQQFQQVPQAQPQIVYTNADYSMNQQPMAYTGQPMYVDQAGIPMASQGNYIPQQQMYAPGNPYGGQTY
ncbi:hypothetical protein LPJ78_002105 [Coemansia sp. RSA 989]|nr:hypothetical protein BX667DRAFT_498723 [Coemansia mojavensis]KAJ1741662.1 hypothetical protein LPJ68_002627 [Coemansia sp. RSA 1086]KAJ1751584.1 hypothetical protein LPJ79_001958 [Coemansia sp. RSA 1821]KAJ1866106.1 hypothetical protein LPJ78_002105 [Coemansia sp. RSA 989]KAJ1875995.1 hypothetical protein LPJ55_000175 [Coemansia sp. RSA 990]KAJ2674104.1 hypothetical protein IWW42_001924 [Coemansia sp. RSA 1085]